MADVNIDINVAAKQALKSLKGLETQAEKSTKSVTGLGFSMVKLNATIEVGRKVYNVLKGAFSSVIDAAAIQEEAINELNIAMKSAGGAGTGASEKFQEFASELQRTSKFGDEATIKAGALFLQLTKNTGAMEGAVKAAANMSAALGMDLKASVTLIAKTMTDTGISGLKQYAINVEKGKTPAEDLARSIEKINTQFSGAAAGQVDVFSGALQQSKNSFGDLLEEVGFFITKNPLVLEGIKASTKLFQELGATVKSVVSDFTPSLEKSKADWSSYTRMIDETEKAIEKLEKTERSMFNIFTSKEAKIKSLSAELKTYKEQQYIASLEIAQHVKDDAAETVKAEQKKFDIVKTLGEASAAYTLEQDEIKKEREAIGKSEELQALADTLGEKEVMLALHDAKKLEASDQHGKAVERLQKLQEKSEKESLFRRQKFEDLTAKQKLANLESTLGTIATLSSSNSKILGGIGKSAAVSSATINTYKAANMAWAAPPGPPWSGIYVGAVIAAGLANVAKIVGIPLAEGGIVQPRPGGVPTILAEAGKPEAVIPLDNFGSLGVTVNIYGDVVDEDSFVDRLVSKINDGIEFRNLQLKTT